MSGVSSQTQVVETCTNEDLSKKVAELEEQISALQIKMQSSIDLTDDLVNTASNSMTAVVNQADNILSHTDTLISVYLVVLTFILTALGAWITHNLNKKREDYIKDAVDGITSKIKKDDELMNRIIVSLVQDKVITDNIANAIDSTVQQRVSEIDKEYFSGGVEDE